MRKSLIVICFIFLLFYLIGEISWAADDQDQGGSDSSGTQQQPPPDQGTGQPPPPAPSTGQYTYREIKTLQEQLELIKERLVQYRARLLELRDQLALTKMAVVSAAIKYRDDVSGTFHLVEAHFYLDGFEIYRGSGDDVHKAKEIGIYQGSLLPGEHLLSAELLYGGKGYGIFSYMKKNVYRVRSRYTFNVDEGEEVDLGVVSVDKGGLMSSVGDRLKLEYTINKKSITAEEEQPPSSATQKGTEENKGDKDKKRKKVVE